MKKAFTAIIPNPGKAKPIYKFHPPDTGTRPHCDFRIDFDEGMTLKEIACKYHCDQRTVRTCILLNKSSTELGQQYAPTRLAPFIEQVEELYREYLCRREFTGIMRVSREITAIIASQGYTGSERTVRNYIRVHCLPNPTPDD